MRFNLMWAVAPSQGRRGSSRKHVLSIFLYCLRLVCVRDRCRVTHKNKNSRRQLHAAMMIPKIDNAMNLKLPSTVRRNRSLVASYGVGYVIWVAAIT